MAVGYSLNLGKEQLKTLFYLTFIILHLDTTFDFANSFPKVINKYNINTTSVVKDKFSLTVQLLVVC